MKELLTKKFKELYKDNNNEIIYVFAPGRVNVIGEHIDYNGGYVLPCAIDRGTFFAIAKNNTNKVRCYSLQFEDTGIVEFDVKDDSHNKDFADYVKGCIKIFDIDFGFDFVCNGTIPHSSGLSSSSSFCAGLGYALTSLNGSTIKNTKLALMCKDVENKFIGVNCGIMDQFIICNGKKDMALLLDCATLKYDEVPLKLDGYTLVIAGTNKKRKLSDSKYNERRAECEESLAILNANGFNLENLCQIQDLDKALSLLNKENLVKRVRHVVSENNRTINACKALKEGNILQLGKFLTESHMSLKDDYEVTGIELDTLVLNFLKNPNCIGARMTGAGFGGCAIALIKQGHEKEACDLVKEAYVKEIGYEPSFYLTNVEGQVSNF